MQRYSYGQTPAKAIRKAIGETRYPMTLSRSDAAVAVKAINQGIDSHLEGITDSRFGREQGNITGNRLTIDMGPADLLVFLRRLLEIGATAEDEKEADSAMSLRTDILATLDIEEV